MKDCPICESGQTFNFEDYDQSSWMNKVAKAGASFEEQYKGQTLKINYQCKGCHSFQMVFTLRFSDNGSNIFKIGQFPPIAIQPSKEIKLFLKEYTDLFKKGLICESQSYGIGAFSYYRRIVELEIGRLLDEIESQVTTEDSDAFKAALKEVKESHYAKDKIDLISKVIPSHLKPKGTNPIGLLYRVLSEGIHSLSDDQCLEKAKAVRQTLESLIHLLNANKDAIAKLSAASYELITLSKK
ncbi:MAG: hypothetical protein ACXWR0_11320 [Bdellovibrio sp.]